MALWASPRTIGANWNGALVLTAPLPDAVGVVERLDEVEDDHLPLDMALVLLSDCTDMACFAGAGSANVAYVARQSLSLIQSQAARIAELEARAEWQPMRSAPKDGTEIETLCVHPTAHYSSDALGEGWAAVVRSKWIDHNGGGWTWNGLCGIHMAWRPVRQARSLLSEGEGRDR